MIRVLCNGKCHIDPECMEHNPQELTPSIYTHVESTGVFSRPHICPVCNGAGKLPSVTIDGQPVGNCHGCNNKGWVAI